MCLPQKLPGRAAEMRVEFDIFEYGYHPCHLLVDVDIQELPCLCFWDLHIRFFYCDSRCYFNEDRFFFSPSHSLLEYLPSCQSNPAPIHTLSSFDQAKNLDSQRVNQRGQIIKMMAMMVINRARWHSGKNFDRNQVELILNVYKACWLSEF